MPKHTAVWIDHKEAHVFQIDQDEANKTTVRAAPQSIHHRHPKGPEGAREHPDDAQRFYHEVATSLVGSEQVLIVGPSTAKLEFIRHVHKHDHLLDPKIVGIETVDHPTDGQLVAYAKNYFKLAQ